MQAITDLEAKYRKPQVAAVKSGDTVRVHQVIREGSKERIQIFEGVVLRTGRMGSLGATITVRRIASGVGVEKTYLLHSPNVTKVEVMRRAKVRRNFLSYLRERRGKSARLQEIGFDKAAVNVAPPKLQADAVDEAEDAEITELDGNSSVAPEESVAEGQKVEDKQAGADDITPETNAPGEDDENSLPAEEAQIGVDRANDEDDRAQKAA
jgi:large subunit ribosomal protein L19